MDIKILVATHKKYWMPDDDVYLPIHVGKEGKQDLGYIGDNTGDNISIKNPNYCELTAMYWAWKNLQADYVGLVHYRRYFTNSEVIGTERKRKQILRRYDWERLLAEYPVIVPGKRKYYIESNYSHYVHAHHGEGLDAAIECIKNKYPNYVPYMEKIMNRTWAHMFNMLVMRKDLYDQYMSWLFDVLTEIERKIDVSTYSTYEARVYGFVSERLLDIWIEANKVEYKEQNVSFMESQNWIKKGGAFLKRKLIN